MVRIWVILKMGVYNERLDKQKGEKMAGFNTKNKNDHGEYEITFYTDDENEYKYIQQCCRNVIDHTIEPERKKGRWIDETFKPWGLVHHPYKCDQCGEHSEADSDFCPNCGAEMER